MNNNSKIDEISKEEWLHRLEKFPIKQADMNRLIMNYFVTEGFKEAAENFQREAKLKPSVELNSLDDRILIRKAVQNGRIEEATQLVNQLIPDLLETDRYLFFHLQQLQLIELIRAGKIEEALSFVQKKLPESSEDKPEAMFELERTLALLAFEKPEESPFSDLLDQSYRQNIANELNAAVLNWEHSDVSTPKMMFLLKLILWAQSELDKRLVNYPKMHDLEKVVIDPK